MNMGILKSAGIIKHLKSLLPLPRKWSEEEKAFGLRVDNAYRETQIFMRDASEKMTGYKVFGTENAVSDLDQFAVGTWGRATFTAGTTPSSSSSNVGPFNYICFGGSDTNRTVLVFGYSAAWFNSRASDGWRGWEKFTLT